MNTHLKKIAILLSTLLITSANSAELIVKITGVEDKKMRKNAQNAALISQHHKKEAPDELRVRWLHQNAANEIADSFIPYGYYNATVTSSLTQEEGKWIATYNVSLNEPIKLTSLNLKLTGEGENYRPLKRSLNKTKMKVGQILDHDDYENTKNSLMDITQERGYFDAHFTQNEIRVDTDRATTDVNLTLDTGQRYKFGNVTFNQEYFDEALLQRFVTFHQNSDNYSDNRISEFQSHLAAGDYFDIIMINPMTDAESKTVPLDVHLTRRKQRTFSAGVGYSTDIKFRASLGMDWHYINSKGHKLVTDLMWGQKKRDGVIKYSIPGHDPVNDKYNLFLLYDYEDTRDKDYNSFTIGGSIDKDRRLWSFGYGLEYQYDRFRDLHGNKQNTKVLMPSIYAGWKSQDAVRFGDTGIKIFAKLRGADKNLGSDVSFIQAHIKADYILPLGINNRLLMRGELGYTYLSDGDLNRLPPSLRFYAGGDNSVRGYRLDGIGEYDYRGKIAGGKRLTVASIEYEHKINKDFSAAAFIDAGDAYNGATPNFKVGAGAGIRWYSPIGAVRFDAAHGFDKQGDTVRLHLTIGTEL